MPDHIGLNSLSLSLRYYSLFNPSDRLPALELNLNFIGCNGFHKIEEDMAVDSITSKVERLINLDEAGCHLY